MLKIINTFLIVVLVTSLVISTIYLTFHYKEDKKQEKIFYELEDVVSEKIENTMIEETQINNTVKTEVDLQKLYNMNSDFIGWLEIEDTSISYPVMQTDKNRQDYYLRKNFHKEYSVWGTPYIAEYCNVLESDALIIYGHNIEGNRMFGELEKYQNKSFYENHKKIKFNTLYEEAEYEIIFVFKTIANTGFNYYEFYNLNEEEFDTFIKKCTELSLYDTGKSAEYGERFIMLSTCEYSNTNGRLVVVARKLPKEGE